MIRFYMDENVDGPITRGLRQRDIDVLTVQEDGFSGAPDPEVLDRALELDRVLVSQDIDLVIEANYRQTLFTAFAGVIYAPKGKASIGRYIEDLELIALAEEIQDYAGRVQFLPL